ncbi:MAG: hypothetical protein ACFFB3_01115 [Candidatus Hodarchaeota archaeon]
MPSVPSDITRAYTIALEWISERFEGRLPSEFRIYYNNQLFPVLLRSEAIRLTGSPTGLLSTPEERALHRNSKMRIPLVQPFLSVPGKGYLFGSETVASPLDVVFYSSQFVRLLAAFFLGENSLQSVSVKNEELHQMDITLSSLLTRAISLSPAANRSWACQYLRDLAALIVRFSVMPTHAFHEPFESEKTSYAEFLRQLIPYAKKRASLWRSISLHRAILNGLTCACARMYLRDTPAQSATSEGVAGKIIADVLESSFHSFDDILDYFESWQSDKSLFESIQPAKFRLAAQKASTPPESKKFLDYLRAVSENSLETNGDLWDCNYESDRYLGHLESKKGPIYFYELFRTQIVPEQLLILHNHSKPLDDPYSLPSTASIIAFRKTNHQDSLASYFQPEISSEIPCPKNPWDFPYRIDSVIANLATTIEKSEWDKFQVQTWISKGELEKIGLNDDQLACTLLLLKGKTPS